MKREGISQRNKQEAKSKSEGAGEIQISDGSSCSRIFPTTAWKCHKTPSVPGCNTRSCDKGTPKEI